MKRRCILPDASTVRTKSFPAGSGATGVVASSGRLGGQADEGIIAEWGDGFQCSNVM